jgi:hypothetical protein
MEGEKPSSKSCPVLNFPQQSISDNSQTGIVVNLNFTPQEMSNASDYRK